MSAKPLPCNLDAEATFIGCALADGTTASVCHWLPIDAFTDPVYRCAWQAVLSLAADGLPSDLTMVLDRMERLSNVMAQESAKVMQTVAGDQLLIATNAEHYGRLILECAQRRDLINAARRLAMDAANEAIPAAQVGQVGMQRLSRILSASPDHQQGRKTWNHVLDALYEDVYARMEQRGRYGLMTGFPRLDRLTGGFEPGQLILIAARPGAGKSAFGLSLGRRIAGHFHHDGAGAVDIVTMEMSYLSQARRIIASRSGLDTKLMRQGFHRTPDEFDELAYRRFVDDLEADRVAVGDHLAFHEGIITTEQLAILATDAKVNHGTRIFIIDQLDLFGDTNKNGETERISEISKKLKQLAMRLGVIIICLVQLNRQTEQRGDHRPQLSDLRQSGRLEQDADIVFALYRPSYYFEPETPGSAYAQWAELLTLKYRDGQSGVMIPLRFLEQSASYTDWDESLGSIRDMMSLVEGKEHKR